MSAIETYSAADVASKHIRGLILRGDLAPGAKLNLEELAATLGMSRTPVRDSLAGLQDQGLVEIVSRVGVYVREIRNEEILDVYAIKESLEPVMARWATRRSSEEERASFADSAESLRELSVLGDSGSYVELVIRRRDRMIELARSEILTLIFRKIDERVRVLRARNLSDDQRRTDSCREQLAIAEAVRVGDTELAAELTRAHVESARISLTSMVERARASAGTPT